MDRLKSRKATPWDREDNMTSTQSFLKQYYASHYAERHCIVADSGEADMINSYIPTNVI